MIDSTSEVVIPLSKGKLALLVLAGIPFVAGGIWMWSSAASQTWYDAFYMKSVAVAGVSFFGLCGIYGSYKILDGRPGLIIDDQGIVDNSSAASAGRVFWDEIVALKVSEIAGQRLLTVEVADPKKYVERHGFLLRMLHAANVKMMRSPINITSNSLKVNFDELVRILTASFEKHRAPGPALASPQRTTVAFDEDSVTCRRPGGLVETVRWSDLQIVYIRTTDEGPAVDDVFWVLLGRQSRCVVPSEAEGTGALLKRLQRLPNFNYNAAIKAMSSAENREFLCWQRSTTEPGPTPSQGDT